MSRGGGTLCALGADTSGDVLDSLFTTDMDQDEIVQTSDAEEREELDARGELYWQRQSSSSSTEHDSHPPPKRSKVGSYQR